MAKDITLSNGNLPATEGFARIADEESTKGLKFVKGDWETFDEDKMNGASVLALINDLRVGWRKWRDGKLVAAHMGRVADNYVPKLREELGDLDPEEWETDTRNEQQDPWQYCYSLRFTDEKGDVYTWAATSFGARKAVGSLSRQYLARLRTGFTGLPTVKLENGPYKHRQYGKVEAPVLTVVGWEDDDAPPPAIAVPAPNPPPAPNLPPMTITSGAELKEVAKAHAVEKGKPLNDPPPNLAAG